jgi:hypothetical protein
MTKIKLTTVFLCWIVILPGWAEEKVLFYSQSAAVTQEQLKFYRSAYSTTRPFIPLLGIYDLFDSRTQKKVGQVNIPAVYYETHPFIFRKNFRLPDISASNYFLHFGQLNGDVRIAVNNKMLYQGSQNFLPFEIYLPAGILNQEDNLLEVQIIPWRGQEEQLPDWIPINLPKIYSGINGLVYLQAVPHQFIAQISSRCEIIAGEVQILGEILIDTPSGSPDNLELEIQLLQNAGVIWNSIIPAKLDSLAETLILPFDIKIPEITPWSNDNPIQHLLQVTLRQDQVIVDQLTKRLAIRDVSIQDKRFVLNGRAVNLQGINYLYQDLQGSGLIDRQLILNDLQTLKSNGFNLIRLGYYPQSPLFYHLSDSLGILCLQDLPYPLLMEQMVTDTLAFRQLLEYVRIYTLLAEQHPSIIGIGLGNLYHDPGLKQFSKEQRKLRTLLSANDHFLSYTSSFDLTTFPNDFADFYCLEILERNKPDIIMKDLEKLSQTDYPMLISGLSKPISYRVDSLWIRQEVTQNAVLFRYISQASWKDQFLGLTLFTYTDYLLQTPSLSAGSVDRENFILNSSGLYTLDRKIKKEAEFIIKQKWLLLDNNGRLKILGENQTYVFIIFGLINLFVFLFLYRSFVDFRKNIFRAIRKPHGFFVELLERRMISFEQSFFMMFLISLNGAVMLASILYFFRNNLLADYLLSIPLAFSNLKLIIAQIIWKPLWMVPIFTLLIMVIFIFLTIPIQLLSLLRGTKIRIRQSLATSAWSAAPFLLLLPFGMFFYNLLMVMNSYWILFVILLYFHFWYYMRWLNGTRVMCLWSYPWVFLYSLLLIFIFGGGFVLYLQQKIDVPLHLNFLTQLLQFHFN